MTQLEQPKKWKTAVIVWIAIVPLIFTIMPLGRPILVSMGLNPTLAELLLTTLLVFLMVYFAQPLVTKIFSKWLNK